MLGCKVLAVCGQALYFIVIFEGEMNKQIYVYIYIYILYIYIYIHVTYTYTHTPSHEKCNINRTSQLNEEEKHT